MQPSTAERREDQLQRVLDKYHADLKSLLEVQGWHGNWNYSPYMRGLYNGMELALATFEGREPAYKDGPTPPDKYLCDQEPSAAEPNHPTTGNLEDMAAAEAFRSNYQSDKE